MLGTEWRLRAYRADGGELWQKPVPGVAWGVNIGGNGRLVVAAYGDGTIRWHRLSDGQELLALFVHAKDRRYIAWTPQGYYAASPGGGRPHRLACQSRLRHRAGLLPRLHLRQHLQPARHRESRAGHLTAIVVPEAAYGYPGPFQ